jgi:AcrR family transcriptional regulator
MGLTLGMRHKVLKAGSPKMPGNRTKHAPMSGNDARPRKKMDRRVLRTRDVLGDALMALIHEKPFAEISVQDVLDRAQISRSTFYTHYSDKDDLFLSDAEDFFEMIAFHISRKDERSNRVAPVREMFAHIADVHEFYAALVASGKLHDILGLGQGYFARGIEQRLNYFKPDLAPSQRTALANAFAGAFMSLMSWWIHHSMSPSPEQMDELYHRTIWCGIGAPTR